MDTPSPSSGAPVGGLYDPALHIVNTALQQFVILRVTFCGRDAPQEYPSILNQIRRIEATFFRSFEHRERRTCGPDGVSLNARQIWIRRVDGRV
jgi:hypothetical protein